jgi:hypothetical protein
LFAFDFFFFLISRNLSTDGIVTRACSDFTPAELRDLMTTLLSAADPKLQELYHSKYDRRRLRYKSLEEFERLWNEEESLAELHPQAARIVRDGRCHEA